MSERTLEERVDMLEKRIMVLAAVIESMTKVLVVQEKNAKAMTEIMKIIASETFGVDVDEINEYIEKEERKLS